MPDIFQTSPPAWLVDIAKPIDTKLTGQVLGSVIAGGLMAGERAEKPESKGWLSEFLPAAHEAKLNLIDPMWKLKAQQAQLGIMQNALGIISEQQKIDANKTKMALTAQDTQDIPKWLQEHPTVESRMEAQWPAARTPEWNRNLDQLRLRDSQSVQTKIVVSGIDAFKNRLAELAKDDKTAAAQIAGAAGRYTQQGQMPPPELLESLSTAEAAVQQRKENERQAAIAAAQAAGQVPETRITDKGITTIYKPKTEADTAAAANRARVGTEMTMPSGIHAVWVGPNQIRITDKSGKDTDLTPAQLQKYASDFQYSSNPTARATAQSIQKWLGEKAQEQLSRPGTNAPAAKPPPQTPQSTERIQVRGKDGKLYTVPKSQRKQAIDEGYTPVE